MRECEGDDIYGFLPFLLENRGYIKDVTFYNIDADNERLICRYNKNGKNYKQCALTNINSIDAHFEFDYTKKEAK